MTYLYCPDCNRKNVYLRADADPAYLCHNKRCGWWVFKDPETNDEAADLIALQRANPHAEITELPPPDAEIT